MAGFFLSNMWVEHKQQPIPSHTAHRKNINTMIAHFIQYLDYSIIIV